MKFLIILFTILVLLQSPAHATIDWSTVDWRRKQLECVKQVKQELNYPTHKAVRYCNGGQMK
jgi:hypothetical protein